MHIATALSYKREITDIYSNSWGPSDSGSFVGGPGTLTERVLRDGALEVSNPTTINALLYLIPRQFYLPQGRGGKGSIFVWANGNGGDADDCAADGYVISIYTISIGALQVDGTQASYDEKCSAKLASNFVNDLYDNGRVVSTF